jgi:serine/threonine protein kinase
MKNVLVGNRYRLLEKIGSGSFGAVYMASDIHEKQKRVSVKLEKIEHGKKHSQLLYEHKIYQMLKNLPDFPNVFWVGAYKTEQESFNVLVMDLLGPNLEDILEYNQRRLTLRTVLILGLQALERLQALHNQGILHRDVKPENFVMGIGEESNTLYLIDYGLAKCFKTPDGKHIPPREGKSLTGTVRYASIHTQMGKEQARRDDLESLLYVLIYFLRGGDLPWMNLKIQDKKTKYNKIKEKKMKTPLTTLCKGLPDVFAHLLVYVRKLKFDEEPNYLFMKTLLEECFEEKGYTNVESLQWT